MSLLFLTKVVKIFSYKLGNCDVNYLNWFWKPQKIKQIKIFQGQFSYACVEIQPLDHGSNQVTLRIRDILKDLGLTSEPRVVSDLNLGILARQLALHANVSIAHQKEIW